MSVKTKAHNKQKSFTITGYVLDFETDDDSRGLFISTEYDEDFIVKLDRVGEELFDHLDDLVEANGYVEYDDDGDRYITVKSFNVIDEDDDDYDDDEGFDSFDDDDWD
jgi:hypothetical protein